VILYVILTGQLPFDDSNIKKLYHKIVQGTFAIPEMVTPRKCVFYCCVALPLTTLLFIPEAKDLIQNMIVVDPKKRASLQSIKDHPWTNEGYAEPVDPCIPPREKIPQVDEAVLQKVVMYGFELDDARQQITSENPTPASAIYHLLEERAKRMEKEKEEAGANEKPAAERPTSAANSAAAAAAAAITQPSSDKEKSLLSKMSRRRTVAGEVSKESAPPHSAPIKKPDTTALDQPVKAKEAALPPIQNSAPPSSTSASIAADSKPSVASVSTAKESKEEEKKPSMMRRFTLGGESKKKTKEGESNEEGKLRSVKGLFNVATSTSKPIPDIVDLVSKVLEKNAIQFTLNGYVFACQDVSGQSPVEFEIEVCKIYKLNLHGLHLRRTRGEAWLYKNVCSKLSSQWKL
jgi:serine/threonine protein kinase